MEPGKFILKFIWEEKKMYNKQHDINIVVQSPSHVQLFATPWTAACQAPLSSVFRVCSNSCPLSQ